MEVERLFRLKRLDVVFATGTLAQGIHMPCRTVVLAGESPYLTAVMMRQIAGRAGMSPLIGFFFFDYYHRSTWI